MIQLGNPQHIQLPRGYLKSKYSSLRHIHYRKYYWHNLDIHLRIQVVDLQLVSKYIHFHLVQSHLDNLCS